MRLTVFFLIVAFLYVSAKGVSQNVTLSGKNMTMERVFLEVKLQTGYVFLYPRSVMENARPVSIHANAAPLIEFLEKIFEAQPLKYTVSSKTIYVSPAMTIADVSTDSRSLSELPSNNQPFSTIAFISVNGHVVDEQGKPVAGASVMIKGNTGKGTSTDANGYFELTNVDEKAILVISGINIETFECQVDNRRKLGKLVAVLKIKGEEDVVLINTGYQKLKPNEMAGAADVITKKMLMEQTGSTVMQRLVGMSGSLNFNNKVLPGNTTGNPNSVLNMTIRGYSTISGTTDPLIIVNNFPYTGDIDNIDPNDVESIVILKDAAATAMWGIRAANGVIVITTSGSKLNQKTKMNLTVTSRITEKPDLNKVDVASGPEAYDFLAEYLGNLSSATLAVTGAKPELDYLGWQYYKKGLITKEEFDTKLNAIKALDPKKQWSDLLYRNGNAQTYSLNISGGSEKLAWTIAGSFDEGIGVLQAKSRRSNIRMNTLYKLTDKLSLELGIAYTSSFSQTGAPAYNSYNDGGRYMVTRPLANADGTPYGWWINYSPVYMDTVAGGLFGDLKFYALEDWKHNYTRTDLVNYVKNVAIKYSPLKDLDISVNVQGSNQTAIATNVLDNESYFTRYNQALFSEINRATKIITRYIPLGEFRKIRNNYANSFNARMDINYKRTINKGTLLFNGAFDISEANNFSDGKFLGGYKDIPRSYVYVPDLVSVNSTLRGGKVSSSSSLGTQDVIAVKELSQRNISTTGSLSYVYDDRIIFNVNGRRDGANILGVNLKERWKPNYSLALNWKVHKEKFFNIPFISNLSTGISFGYVGNVDVSKSSRIIVRVSTFNSNNTDIPENHYVDIPPNPELRWEKTAHTNLKLDLGFFNDRLQVRTNYFVKKITDLYMTTALDPVQSLSNSAIANAGNMTVKGYEINIQAKIIQSPVNYDITLTTANTKEKLTYFPNTLTYGQNLTYSIPTDGVSISSSNPPLFKDMPLYAIYSLGGNQGVNREGKYFLVYKGVEYTTLTDGLFGALYNQTDMEEVKVYGTGTPTFTGSMHHRVQYKRLSLLFSLQVELGHYFKYPKDKLSNLSLSSQFDKRWKNPGDELHTNIPAYKYPADASWQIYSQYADVNIFKGGVIRLNNIQLNYAVPTKKLRALNLALNIQNLGKIWTANKEGYDYRYLNYMTYNGQDKYYAFTLNIGL